MIKLENTIINADMNDILQLLKQDLATKGIDRFAIFKPNNDDIQTNCPFHKNGQERKPSFGINIRTGQCHCFTCGWSGSVSRMIGEIFLQDEEYGTSWLVRHFNSTEIETRQKIVELPINRWKLEIQKDLQWTEQLEENELDSYRWIHPYMYQRGLTDELIEEFDIGYDKETNCITFPCYNEKNQLVFVARRNVDTKFYKYPQGVDKPIYALPKITSKEVYVVESFFNCLTLWKLGKQSIAMIGTGTAQQYEILKKSNIRTFILAFDPDEAGRRATIRFRKALGKYKNIKEVVYEEEGKDVNDLDSDFLKLKIIL